MILVLPFCPGDAAQAIDLLEWNDLLGGSSRHDALLVGDAAVDWTQGARLLELARTQFKSVRLICTHEPLLGWPESANAMFLLAAERLLDCGQPFFWCEPDCVPLRPGWLDDLEREHLRLGRLFSGAWVRGSHSSHPSVSLGGCAVYPPDAARRIGRFCDGKTAWDVASAGTVIPQSAQSSMVQWFWGEKGAPPTFAERITALSPRNTLALSFVNRKAAVFHRNKDGTLIRLLRRERFPGMEPAQTRLSVALSFCNRDALLAIKNLQWIGELGGCPDNDCWLVMDSDVLPDWERQAAREAGKSFAHVKSLRYQCGSVCPWPHGANVAFRRTALALAGTGRPWLWLEPDAIPIRPGWLQELEREYGRGGKPFMGAIVEGMGHCNGVAVYPANTPDLIPRALDPAIQPRHVAWDWAMKPEMIHLCHDAGHLIQHVWGIGPDGQPHPSSGNPPVFDAAWKLTRWVKKTAVLFHRCKDGSLIDCVREFDRLGLSV